MSYRIIDNGYHATLTLWVNGACAGTITVRSAKEEGEWLALDIVRKALDDNGAAYDHYGSQPSEGGHG